MGDGPPLIFLHGLFGALSNFEGPIAYFSKKYRVVMPMLPLYTLPMLNTNVPALADFLDRFVRHKGFSEMELPGIHGGHVALIPYQTRRTHPNAHPHRQQRPVRERLRWRLPPP